MMDTNDWVLMYLVLVLPIYIYAMWRLDDGMDSTVASIIAFVVAIFWPLTAIVGTFLILGEIVIGVKDHVNG